MPHYIFSAKRTDEILYARSLPTLWMGELGVPCLDKTSREVLDRLQRDYGTEHVDQILAEAPNLTDTSIETYLTKSGWTPCDTTAYTSKIANSQANIDAFFAKHFTTTPSTIRVHLTNVGSGGSFHPLGEHWLSQQEPAISVRPNCRTEKPLYVIVHETIHLAINASVDTAFKDRNLYQIKEAIVDQVMSSLL